MNDQEIIEMLANALSGLLDIVEDSAGVSGYHLNGVVAEWGEFNEVKEAYDILNSVLACSVGNL